MSCAFDKERLTAYYDGELGPADKSEVERHISSCSECLRDLGEIKSAVLMVRGLPRYPAPPSVAEGVSRAVAAAGCSARFRALRGTLLWATAAAAGLLIVLNVVFFTDFQNRAARETAVTAPRAVSPGLAWKGAPAEEEDGEVSRQADAARPAAPKAPATGKVATGKGDWEESLRLEQKPSSPPHAGAAVDGTGRRAAALQEAGRPLVDGAEQQAGRNALKVGDAPPAALPPAAAERSPDPRRGAMETEVRKSGVSGEEGASLRMGRLRADVETEAAGKVSEKKFADGRRWGGTDRRPQPLVLTLSAPDPAAARSKVVEFLKKAGAAVGEGGGGGGEELSRSRREAAEAVSKPLKAAERMVPLTVDLSARQLAVLRAEIRKEKSILVVREPSERLEEVADRAGTESQRDVDARRLAAAAPAPKPEESHPSPGAPALDRPEQSKAAPTEPRAAEVDEEIPRGASEPILYRLTVEFTIREAPLEERERK